MLPELSSETSKFTGLALDKNEAMEWYVHMIQSIFSHNIKKLFIINKQTDRYLSYYLEIIIYCITELS